MKFNSSFSKMMTFILLCALLATVIEALPKTDSDSLRAIAEKVNNLRTTWTADTNISSGLTISSFEKLFGVKKSGLKLPIKPKNMSSNIYIPKQFDARKEWSYCPTISHITDQGVCGSCWANAAAATLADRFCIATRGAFTLPLSEEELLSCCDECGYGCISGDPAQAWYFFYLTGLVTGGDYNSRKGCQPYSIPPCEHFTTGSLPNCSTLPMTDTPQCKHHCTNPYYRNTFSQDHHKVKETYFLTSYSVSEIQKEIMARGPVQATFTAYADLLTYKSGVYKHVTGRKVGVHSARILGWGLENNEPYWLIANSWNTHWGDNGLFKIRRGYNECGIEKEIISGIPKI